MTLFILSLLENTGSFSNGTLPRAGIKLLSLKLDLFPFSTLKSCVGIGQSSNSFSTFLGEVATHEWATLSIDFSSS